MITIRTLRPEESGVFLDIHGRSVHGLASSHYPVDILNVWGASATLEAIRRFDASAGNDVRLVAELDGVPAGVGCLSLHDSEVTACYVAPEAVRQGVGTALMAAMERLAREAGLDHVTLVSSLNAEPFYASIGYHVVERTEHMLRGTIAIQAVRMAKALT